MVGTEKPLFLLRAFPKKKSDFAVLASDDVNLEPVGWHPSVQEPPQLIADEFNLESVERCPSARELLGTRTVTVHAAVLITDELNLETH